MHQEVETYGVFWDIENLAYRKKKDGSAISHGEKVALVNSLAAALPVYMSLWGLVPHPMWQLVYAERHLPACYVAALRRRGYAVDLNIRTKHNAADGRFRRAIWEAKKGYRPALPYMMCIITGDADFYQHLHELRKLGCVVWVVNCSREQTARVLLRGSDRYRGADRFIAFPNLLKEASLANGKHP